MKTVSLKIDDAILGETEHVLQSVKKSRNRYFNEAIDYYNKLQKRKALAKALQIESNLVGEESLAVVNEFEEIDYAD